VSWLDRILSRLRAASSPSDCAATVDSAIEGDPADDGADDHELPVILPIEDSIDLHPFHPREIRDVVRGYLDEAWERGFEEVRIIHGRGVGQQRHAVRRLLERDARIARYADAGAERGGWGATVAHFVPRRPEHPRERD
jgi:dsDNA-specific endonuclease/ATPase MutS2